MRTKGSFVLVASIWLLVVIVAGLLPSRSVAGLTPQALAQSAPDMAPRAYLPYVSKADGPATPTPTPPPGPVGLRVYDMYGFERTYEWAVNKYGVRVQQIEGEAYHCVELRERSGPAGIDVHVYQRDGQPAVGVRVEFHWPDGMDWRLTEPDGKAGFGYGSGSWIYDPAVGGPHWLVVLNESSCDLVSRLGMLAGTNHDHLDVKYKYGVLGE